MLNILNRNTIISFLLIIGIIANFSHAYTIDATTKYALSSGFLYGWQGGYSDTRPHADNAEDDFDASGYSCAKWINKSANMVYDDLEIDYIFLICGHGERGYTLLYDYSSYSHIMGSGGINTTSKKYINNLSSNELDDMILAVYANCRSGLTSSTYGNLLTSTTSKGADCALGWASDIDIDSMEVWLEEFTSSLRSGNSVHSAIADADQEIINSGTYVGGSDYHIYSGNSSVTIR